MNETMWKQPATQRNLAQLMSDGFQIVAPVEGWQACRTVGDGRLPESDDLVDSIVTALNRA